MGKTGYVVLFFAGLLLALMSCSSGAYVANPSTNANNSINPLNPLKASQFTWTGSGLFSMNIDGNPWVADTAYTYYSSTTQTNVVVATKGKSIVYMYLANVWTGTVYNMGFKTYTCLTEYMDSLGAPVFQSALGNSGEFYMVKNDTLNFDGKFYFQGISTDSSISNFTNGVFTLLKY